MNTLKEEKETSFFINPFHAVMWIVVLTLIILGFAGGVRTGSVPYILMFFMGLFLLYNGFGELPSNPRTYGVITIMGRRTKMYVREGWYILPKVFGLGHIPVQVKVVDVDHPITVTTKDNQRMSGFASISYTVNVDSFGRFLDVGGYEGISEQLKGIAELAVQNVASETDMLELETGLSQLSARVYDVLSGKVDLENPHNDIGGLGVDKLKKVQITLAPAPAIVEARLQTKVIAGNMEAVQKQNELTIEIARDLQAAKTGVPKEKITQVQEEFLKEAKDIVQLALRQITQTNIKGGNAVVFANQRP